MHNPKFLFFSLIAICFLAACSENITSDGNLDNLPEPWQDTYPAIATTFDGKIDLDNLPNYANQDMPSYITKDNTNGNQITDIGATLGRVLFYDVKLSVNNDIACASCHQQEFAFGDDAKLSTGTNGVTGRHSMRIINSRFGDEFRFFWDERASSLEEQATMPIQDHTEMGFSGEDDDPSFDDLITKLEAVDYYQELFTVAYGDANITEVRIQECLAQFVRSIQSFDSKFDAGRMNVNNINQDFANYTSVENLGKSLFLAPPPQGGAGCAGCHRGEEFDIDPNSLNNGVTTVATTTNGTSDLTVTRAPTLRDIFNPSGIMNGDLMHDGSFTSLEDVIDHYNRITPDPNNTNLDPRLAGGPGGNGQDLRLTDAEKEALVAFIKTLVGTNVYTDEKWSSPF